MPHETSSIFTLERPFRGARQRLRSKLGGLDCSTWLSVDGLLGFPASSGGFGKRGHKLFEPTEVPLFIPGDLYKSREIPHQALDYLGSKPWALSKSQGWDPRGCYTSA